MRVHVLQHAFFEGLGNIENWLRQQGATISYTRLYEAAKFPAVEQLDLIIALGGPMSVNDEAELPWLIQEKQFIAQAIREGVAVLGICLGAQLIASAMGKRVYPGPEKEIGWHPIHVTDNSSSTFNFPNTVSVLHWHGETFDLPDEAVNLAESVVCKHQAFQLGRRVIGLQFHMEMTRESIEKMLVHCAGDLTEGNFVQSEQVIRAASNERLSALEHLMAELLSYITQGIDKRSGHHLLSMTR
ncbi:type 1 glutamine amidotransferase [Pseudomonas sp. SLFW]|uniref:type 1 glutamine amidotransferase n=1 Tax=Pseudomonas sp. SLFW TaxID=2683259 RepID=UPI001411C9ED|nr:amidotransferase [Pseudomonas sp. SLFW]NBB09363.1 amidotransferase [Pseudomonas sp. SLFW]